MTKKKKKKSHSQSLTVLQSAETSETLALDYNGAVEGFCSLSTQETSDWKQNPAVA